MEMMDQIVYYMQFTILTYWLLSVYFSLTVTFIYLLLIWSISLLGCLPHSISRHIQEGPCSSVTCGVVPSAEQYSGFPNWHNW